MMNEPIRHILPFFAALALGGVLGVLAISFWKPQFFVFDEREEVLRTSLWVSAKANPTSIGLGLVSIVSILCAIRYFARRMKPTRR
jgi:hypothetical protein